MVYITPHGGLCNMMRTIIAGYNISKITSIPFSIYWEYTTDKAKDIHAVELSLEYENIFKNSLLPVVYEIPDDVFQYVEPEPVHSYNPIIVDRVNLYDLVRESVNHTNMRIDSWGLTYDLTTSFDRYREAQHLLQFRDEYYSIANTILTTPTIGIHIRRSDFIGKDSVLDISHYVNSISEEIARNQHASFFVATDDKLEEKTLIDLFGDRIKSYHKSSYDRNNPEFIKAGIIDLICLSKCYKIYGSPDSTFSYMAAGLGNSELIMSEEY